MNFSQATPSEFMSVKAKPQHVVMRTQVKPSRVKSDRTKPSQDFLSDSSFVHHSRPSILLSFPSLWGYHGCRNWYSLCWELRAFEDSFCQVWNSLEQSSVCFAHCKEFCLLIFFFMLDLTSFSLEFSSNTDLFLWLADELYFLLWSDLGGWHGGKY